MEALHLLLDAETWAIRSDVIMEQRGVTDEAGMNRLRDDALMIVGTDGG